MGASRRRLRGSCFGDGGRRLTVGPRAARGRGRERRRETGRAIKVVFETLACIGSLEDLGVKTGQGQGRTGLMPRRFVS
jgi:hypothetical protein